ncbi:methyltransferase domain-containing protein [Salinimicrobium sp. GXAS 041]|uniref:methyltransferase domain-containing protein n=1 Tax=Salinimicrobium sp. GXAS 041 TaxID=3400806 RepID=UPI003C732E1C
MKLVNTKYRTRESEVMDDFELKGPELAKTLKDLDKVNKWLGGNKITIEGIKKIISQTKPQAPVKIVDVGCGNGTILREIANYGRKNNLNLELLGIDANPYAIEIAEDLSQDYPEIKFEALNIFSTSFAEKKYDIVLCTLTLHHFEDVRIKHLLEVFLNSANLGIVINDLQRSRTAYYLFQAFCAVFINNPIAREDGLTSILRGFRKRDLEKFSEDLMVKHQKIRWKWAFRYQWILIKPQPK